MGDFRELYIFEDSDKSLNQVLKYIKEMISKMIL